LSAWYPACILAWFSADESEQIRPSTSASLLTRSLAQPSSPSRPCIAVTSFDRQFAGYLAVLHPRAPEYLGLTGGLSDGRAFGEPKAEAKSSSRPWTLTGTPSKRRKIPRKPVIYCPPQPQTANRKPQTALTPTLCESLARTLKTSPQSLESTNYAAAATPTCQSNKARPSNHRGKG